MGPYKLPTTGKAITDLTVLPTVSKSRKPRFELHLKVYDLNNIPLASGTAFVKWHLPYSIHSEHRGRSSKHNVANHRVEFNYAKIVPLRLVIDKNNRLSDYPIEFEVTQEFSNNGVGRDEKIVLGKITLNLAEYVAESEAMLRDLRPASGHSDTARWNFPSATESHHTRQRSSLSAKGTISSFSTGLGVFDSGDGAESMLSTSPSGVSGPPHSAGSSASTGTPLVEEGVTRRYLMQESKINGTLKISVLMVQVDGDRSFVSPPLKSAPVFGGIAGIMASGEVLGGGVVSLHDDLDDPSASIGGGAGSRASRAAAKGRDVSEVQDVYRRALAASWACEQGELPADECIEDIFNGGDGFRRPAGGNTPDSPPVGRTLPSNSSLHSVTEDQDKDSEGSGLGGSGSSERKKGHRFIPKLPLRRKTAPTNIDSAQKTLHKANSSNALRGKGGVGAQFDAGGNNSSSGEEGDTTSSGSTGRPGTGMTYNPHADDDGGFEINATLRPYDLRQLRKPLAVSSDPAFAAIRQHEREDSVLSDRTIKGPGNAGSFDVPRSARSSPGPGFVSSRLLRDNAFGGLASSPMPAGNSSHWRSHGEERGRQSSGHGRDDGNRGGSGADEDQSFKSQDVDENDVRENFMAWQMSSSVAAS
ncbi:hypothetical protein CMQ_5106 [Grosmannia clavigera kw1407]|uniref:C2 NT-type domain-containing protein n=1 Tax=Grosmannia clavigera (strain kw1407 / UAMH 11150) TaxID=655863 RepID=F0XB29_GROCL|nr:uncharacterized protein CMQ_5106 [Grosmannia clavigera kw1407]EFX04844.1 hypothetical protein CMQ_5106 [Grosmannia clavigera kw1407]